MIVIQSHALAKRKRKYFLTSLLTDETTGKGEISLGDSIEKVKQTLSCYELMDGTSSIYENSKSKCGEDFWFEDVHYYFDTKGKFNGYESSNYKGNFETSKGLKLGVSISKMIKLYGKNYSRIWMGGSGHLPGYVYNFENIALTVVISNNSVYMIGFGGNLK